MKKMKILTAFLTAITMTVGAMGAAVYASQSSPVDVNEEFEGIMGDVNYDGVLSIRDAALIAKYMSHPEQLTDAQISAVKAQGDFNGDGRVSVRDVSGIAKYLDKQEKNKNQTPGSTEPTTPSEIITGDMNGDGEVTLRDSYIMTRMLSNEEEYNLAAADYNGDGTFTVRDPAKLVNDIIASGVLGEKYKQPSDIVILKGDANLDGTVDLADLTVIAKYDLSSASYPFINEVAYINADMNSDDAVDSTDLSKMINKQLSK